MAPLVGDAQRALILGHTSIIAATSGQDRAPHLMRAVGCRLSGPDAARLRVSLFLTRSSSQPLLRDVAVNGQIAVVFSEPTTARTLQLKGTDAVLEALQPGDLDLARAYVEKMIVELRAIGFTEETVRGVVSAHNTDLVVLAFTPTASFEQTPGPLAGQPLGAQPGAPA